MRVLEVNDYRSLGGAEVLMDTTVSLLRDRGVDVELFTGDDVPAMRRTPLGYLDSSRARRALATRLERFDPDVVHLHNFYHLLSPGILQTISVHRRRRPLRVVMTAHDYHLVCPSSGLLHVCNGSLRSADVDRLGDATYLLTRRWDERGMAHSMLKLAQHVWNYRMHRRREVIDCVICPSRFLEGVFARNGLPTLWLPNPAPAGRRSGPRPADAVRLVFTGRVGPEKGVAEFLETLPADFPGGFTIVGDGPQLARCRAVVQRRGLDSIVEFTGRLPHDEALAVVARSHVLVLPSLCVENHPMSLLEALAAGTNILASNLGGMREIVETAGVGFVFDPHDPPDLCRALDRVVAAFREGTLNDFDASAFLQERGEQAYVDRLVEAFGREPGMRRRSH